MKTYLEAFILISICLSCKENTITATKKEPTGNVSTVDIILTNEFEHEVVKSQIIERIKDGVYNDYLAELCVDDLARCDVEELGEVKNKEGKYEIIVNHSEWGGYSQHLKEEIINEIIYYTWGNKKLQYNPLQVKLEDGTSPFKNLNQKSKSLYLNFSKKSYLKGGKGYNAYGPNCWYNSISAIVDSSSNYARLKRINSSIWDRPRFMGAAEFRCFMEKFEKVEEPKFGDVIRYYADSIFFDENRYIYNGEVHAAIFIGKDSLDQGKEIALTKNGRSEMDFLMFQDTRNLDKLYLSDNQNDPRIKGYFRLKTGSKFFDPEIYGSKSDCYEAYKIDSTNYSNRFKCLEGKLQKGNCLKNNPCYCYPDDWKISMN